MKHAKLLSAIAWLFITSNVFGQGDCNLLNGVINADPNWGTGWIDLNKVTDFKTGDKVSVTVGGTATKIILRFLPVGGAKGKDQGVVLPALDVPEDRMVEYTFKRYDRNNIDHVSVHGGPNPWGKYPLGDNNGSATLVDICVVPKAE